MSKINNPSVYPVTTPALDDRVIGTDRSNTASDSNGETVQFSFTDILDLFSASIQTAGIDSTPIGSSSPSSGSFTTLDVSGSATLGGSITVEGITKAVGDSSPLRAIAQSAGNAPNIVIQDNTETVISRISTYYSSRSIVLEADPNNTASDTSFNVEIDGTRVMEIQNQDAKFGNYGASSTTGSAGSAGNGQVWIRTTQSNAYQMEVTGDEICTRYNRSGATAGDILQFRRNGTVVGSVSVTASATAYNTSSDRRLKENIHPLTDAIAILANLQPHTYTFIGDPDGTLHLGFIAQELQPVVPTAVTGYEGQRNSDGEDVYMSVDHSKLVPILTAALQEAVSRLEVLESRLEHTGD